MTTHTQLSIIIPCYNEEKRISYTIDKLVYKLQTLHISYEIIIVNDGSTDKTKQIIYNFSKENKNIKIISYSQNKGK
jgi:glycosyltransferase involved in cell wall biosynthesis